MGCRVLGEEALTRASCQLFCPRDFCQGAFLREDQGYKNVNVLSLLGVLSCVYFSVPPLPETTMVSTTTKILSLVSSRANPETVLRLTGKGTTAPGFPYKVAAKPQSYFTSLFWF